MSRLASDKERAKDLPTYKDNDFLNDHVIIHIAPEAKRDILETLQGDVNVSTQHTPNVASVFNMPLVAWSTLADCNLLFCNLFICPVGSKHQMVAPTYVTFDMT